MRFSFIAAKRALTLAIFLVGAVLAVVGCGPEAQPGHEGRWTGELLLRLPGQPEQPAPLWCEGEMEAVGPWSIVFAAWKEAHNEGVQAPCGKPHGIRYGHDFDGKPQLTFMDGEGAASDLRVPLAIDGPDAMEGPILEPPSDKPRYIGVWLRLVRDGARHGKVLGNEGRGSEP